MIPQINLQSINWYRILPYAIIVLLSIMVLSTCNHSENAQLALKKDIEISDLKAKSYASKVDLLKKDLSELEKKKQVEKLKIVTVIKEVEKKINVVSTLNTKGIANYYQNRYKLPVTITQYGVALKDTVAKLNIIELVQKDGFKAELDLTKNVLSISEKKSSIKDTIILNKDLIIGEKDNQIGSHLEIEKSLNKSLKKEKVKKTFWQITTGAAIIGASFLLVK